MERTLRILQVEDSPDDAELILRELRRGGHDLDTLRVETSAAMVNALCDRDWDLVLSDYEVPGFGGMEALRVLHASGADIPFLLVSGAIGEEIAVTAMKAGAHDYVFKGNLARLRPAIERELKEAEVRRRQREADKARRESEQRYQDLFEHAPMPVWVEDFSGVKRMFDAFRDKGVQDFRAFFGTHPEEVRRCAAAIGIKEVNERSVAFFGCQSKDDIPLRFQDFLFEDSWPVFARELAALAEGALLFEAEIPIRDLRGGTKIVALTLSVSPGHEKTLGRVMVTFSDLTQRIQMEQSLEEARRALERAQAMAHLGSWEWDPSRECSQWSQELFHIFGLPRGESGPSYDRFTALVHPEDRARLLGAREEIIAGGEPVVLEYRIRRTDGATRHVQERVEAMPGTDGIRRLRGTIQDVTERCEAEERLRTSEAQMSTVLENTEDIIVSRDLQGRCLYFNAPFAHIVRQLFGVEAHRGLRTLDLHTGEARSHWEAVLERVHRGESYREEFSWAFDGGELRHYETTFNPIRQEGHITGSIETTHDITDRKRGELALRESESRFSTLVEMSPVGIYLTDARGQCEYANPRWCEMAGLTLEEAKGDGWKTGLHPEDRELVSTSWEHMVTSEGHWGLEYRFRDRHGKVTWVYGYAVRLADLEGRTQGYIGTNVDITERRSAEAALQAAKDELERFFSLVPDLVCVASAEGRFTRLNPVWEDVLGYPLEELRSRPFSDFVHPDDVEPTLQEIQGQLDGRPTLSFTNRYRCRDGSYRWLEWHSSGAQDGQLFAAARDITERRQLEAVLKEMEKLSAKGQMAAYIAHEINNPLAGIKNAFALLEGAIPENHRHHGYVDLIKREIDRIAGIIRTMYHVYRPPGTQVADVSLLEAFQDIQALLAPKCRAAGVEIRIDLPERGFLVRMNPGLLRQVFFNLVQNAVEASPPESAVTLKADKAPGETRLIVEDRGAGIPPELKDRIFETGFTTKRDASMSGLGLGLASCRNIVESMGGTLDFEPNGDGRGVRFRVCLPDPAT